MGGERVGNKDGGVKEKRRKRLPLGWGRAPIASKIRETGEQVGGGKKLKKRETEEKGKGTPYSKRREECQGGKTKYCIEGG